MLAPAVAPKVIRRKLDTAAKNEPVRVPGRGLWPLSVPAAANLTVKVGQTSAEPFALGDVGGIEWCQGEFSQLYLSWDAVAGGELVLLILDGTVQVAPKAGGGLYAIYSSSPDAAADGAPVPLLVDPYGRLVVRLGDRLAEDLDAVTVYGPAEAVAVQSWTAGTNTGNVRLVLDTAARPHASAWANLAAAGEVRLQGSRDGATWRTLDSKTLAGAGDAVFHLVGGYRYLALLVVTAAIAAEAELSAR